jgi:hypothetical protein
MGGLRDATVKKLKGAKFRSPDSEMVDTQAIGLGTTEPLNNLYTSFSLNSAVLKSIF